MAAVRCGISESVAYGVGITQNNATVDFHIDIPTSRKNDISFMRIDSGGIATAYNLVAVSLRELFIAYAVSANRSIRLINSTSGEKSVLRGHESGIVDIKFSPADDTVVCSVDNAAGEGNHIHVWRLDPNNLTATSAAPVKTLALPASIVQGHPTTASVWAVAYQNSIGLISVEGPSASPSTVSSYSGLGPASSKAMDGNISGMCRGCLLFFDFFLVCDVEVDMVSSALSSFYDRVYKILHVFSLFNVLFLRSSYLLTAL
jgi:WD40 repeat protein